MTGPYKTCTLDFLPLKESHTDYIARIIYDILIAIAKNKTAIPVDYYYYYILQLPFRRGNRPSCCSRAVQYRTCAR